MKRLKRIGDAAQFFNIGRDRRRGAANRNRIEQGPWHARARKCWHLVFAGVRSRRRAARQVDLWFRQESIVPPVVDDGTESGHLQWSDLFNKTILHI